MLKKEDKFATPPKKLRFRGDLNLHHFQDNRLEDILDEKERRDSVKNTDFVDGKPKSKTFFHNFQTPLHR